MSSVFNIGIAAGAALAAAALDAGMQTADLPLIGFLAMAAASAIAVASVLTDRD
jgi:predicted MFS family arabinose efflux permease